MPVSTNTQIRLLLEEGVDPAGRAYRPGEVAAATGISDQALANLVQGKSSNPRLETLLALSGHYGISLDYFACETEDACREYLRRHRARHASPLICEIENESARLSARGQRNVLAIMEWMQRAAPTAR
jgi:transcriptional regulator with XRE-family HTH domain